MLSKLVVTLAVIICAAGAQNPQVTTITSNNGNAHAVLTITESASAAATSNNGNAHGGGCTGPDNCVAGNTIAVSSNNGNAHGGGCTGPSNCVAGNTSPTASNDGNAHGGSESTGGVVPTAVADVYMMGAIVVAGLGAGVLL